MIAGFDSFAAGKAKTISGIKTPDPRTIVFNLTKPTGDFLYRLAMPATGPIPAEVAGCFDNQAGRYGRDVVSSGPYMFQGADQVDDSSCSALKPMSGFDGVSKLMLVRNPSYDPKTDSRAARGEPAGRVRFHRRREPHGHRRPRRAQAISMTRPRQAFPRRRSRSTRRIPAKRKYLHAFPSDGTSYLTMNLTQPPFDDIHVRRAMNWIIDKAALRQAWGGPIIGKIANHIVPDSIFDNQIADYAPYRTPGDHGSLARAKAAMKGSKYDTRGDGTCAAAECHNVLLLTDSQSTSRRRCR